MTRVEYNKQQIEEYIKSVFEDNPLWIVRRYNKKLTQYYGRQSEFEPEIKGVKIQYVSNKGKILSKQAVLEIMLNDWETFK